MKHPGIRTSGMLVLCLLFLLVVSTSVYGSPTPANIELAPASVAIDVDLPSSSTGTSDGTLALRILAPSTVAAARYSDGAPVVVLVPGGDAQGSLRPQLPLADDVIRISFLFPGGTDRASGRNSDGSYDHRGANSIAALRDVIRFAAGDLADSMGRTIDDVVPVPVLHDNIGLLGSSNGGNIVVAVAAQHGSALAGHLRYVVQWESPVSSQITTIDLGGVSLDCPSGRRRRLDATNPRYLSYGPLVLNVDYSQIAYDPTDRRHAVFLDGNGDGSYSTVVEPRSGCLTPDLNLNGTLETNEDFPLGAYTAGVKWVYSRPATQALADYGVFGGTWPADIATVSEASAFWDLREAVRLYPDALSYLPGLEGMVLATPVDHVQSAPDHPHIRQAFEGWDNAGAWVQINPDSAYLVQADPGLSGRTDLPANSPNTPPADWTDVAAYTVPEDVAVDVLQAAAVWQMADRAHTAGAPTPAPTATPTPTMTPTATPVAPLPTGTPALWKTVSLNALEGWPAAAENHLKIFDVAVDQTRNKVYVHGVLTSGVAVIDGNTDTLVGTLDTGLSDSAPHRTYLAVHPVTGALYMADHHDKELRRIDPATGTITGPVAVSAAPTHILVDAGKNRIYLSLRTARKIAVYDATTLALVREIDVRPAAPFGMVLDSAGQRLYVVDGRPPGGSTWSRLLVINTATLVAQAPITFRNTTGRPPAFVDRDPASGRFFVSTPEDLFRVAPSGAVEWVIGLPTAAKEPLYWPATGNVYVLSRNGISPTRSTLTVVNAVSGTRQATVDLGTGGAQRLALNTATGKLYTPAMEYTDVAQNVRSPGQRGHRQRGGGHCHQPFRRHSLLR